VGVITLDGAAGEGGGQRVRAALALSAGTGQTFEMTRIRAGRSRPGLQPQHLATVHAVALACGAKVKGAFDGSPDLRFEPGPIASGDYRFEIATAGATSLVLQTVAPVVAMGAGPSRVEVTGGTHVPLSPSFEFASRHWADLVGRLGLGVAGTLERAGFYPPGGGEIAARVTGGWRRPASLVLEERGNLVGLRGVSGAAHLKGAVAERQRDGAQRAFWEARRLEVPFEIAEPPAGSPGSFLYIEAVFETGRAAFGFLGQRGVRADILGDRAARRLLTFLEGEPGAVDGHVADQLVVPMALAGGGGRVTTCEVTRHLETVVELVGHFGTTAKVWGRRGGPGGFEMAPS
jgi:RNA 3'-terminal phosphate cyclase (ATP)